MNIRKQAAAASERLVRQPVKYVAIEGSRGGKGTNLIRAGNTAGKDTE